MQWNLATQNRLRTVTPLKTPPGRVRYLAPDEAARLLDACPDWLRPIVVISMNTGMRRGEILGLRYDTLDLANRLINIEQTKNNERRIIPMNQTVYDTLNQYTSRHDTPYVFAQPNGTPYTATNVTTAFRRAAKKARLTNFRLHDLRHHFASSLAMHGHGLRTIQELLGHKDPKMSMRYAHLSNDYLKQAVQDLDQFAKTTPKYAPQK